jgi:hypothetical protein
MMRSLSNDTTNPKPKSKPRPQPQRHRAVGDDRRQRVQVHDRDDDHQDDVKASEDPLQMHMLASGLLGCHSDRPPSPAGIAASPLNVTIMTALPRGEERRMAIELFVFPPSLRAFKVLSVANQRGPHWADPLKSWGDVLAKQEHGKEARTNYDEALTYAPNWAALKAAGEALTKQKS